MTNQTNDTEFLLLKKVAAGDAAAFRILFDTHRNRVFGIGLKLLKSEALAEDTVQEVFLKLWLTKKDLPTVTNFSAYLNTITRHHLLNQLKRLAHAEKFATLQQSKQEHASNPVGEAVERNELQTSLSTAVNRLTPQQKKVYHLGKGEGLSYEEIAGELQISRETVKSHMAEALRSVKAYLLRRDPSLNRLLLAAFSLLKIFF